MGNAIGQRARLSRSGPGDDQQRSIDRLGRRALVVIELREERRCSLAADQPQPRPRRGGGLAVMRWGFGCHNRLWRCGCRSLRDRRIEQQSAGGEAGELVLLEQADDAVFAVVARLADHLSGAQARDRLGEQRGARAGDVLDRHRLQDGQLGTELGDRLIVAARHRARCRAAGGELGENLRQRHQVAYRAGGRRRQRLRLAAVGEHLDAMFDPDRQRLAADGATAAMGERFLGRQPHLAFAMAVEVVFALVGEELDRADIAAAGLQRVLDGEVVEVAVEGGRLPAKLARRVRV